MGKEILLVEDDKFLRELLARKLRNEGFEVLEAIDGNEAIELAKSKKPILILLDLILPGKDGFEVLSEIKKEPETKEIPVLILSNLGQREEIEKGLKLGAFDYFVKAHTSPGEIVEKIRKVIK